MDVAACCVCWPKLADWSCNSRLLRIDRFGGPRFYGSAGQFLYAHRWVFGTSRPVAAPIGNAGTKWYAIAGVALLAAAGVGAGDVWRPWSGSSSRPGSEANLEKRIA